MRSFTAHSKKNVKYDNFYCTSDNELGIIITSLVI